MTLLNREVTFVLMLGTSFAFGVIIRLLGQFRYKKEALSLMGLIQMFWFCEWDSIHLLVMMGVGTALIKVELFGPRVVFMFCFIHRLFFASSKYFGLPRDESNLANATLFIAAMKMVIVAYEVGDFREAKRCEAQNIPYKTKWINLDEEPSAYDILCFMTCFAALFTGPIFRYKSYHDMLYTYVNVPVRNEITTKLITCAAAVAFFFLAPFNFKTYSSEIFNEYNYFIRILIMVIVSLTQIAKYAVAWLLAECVCVLIGLGAYPVSSNSIPGMGPAKQMEVNNKKESQEFNFETITTIKMTDVVLVTSIRGTLQMWNNCTQWWLAYFVYSSTVLPRNWRLLRILNVMFISAAWHGIKPGYFMSFPALVIALIAEDLWRDKVFKTKSTIIFYLYKGFVWLFVKMGIICFLVSVFVLQEFNTILPFIRSMYFYGYIVPIIGVLSGIVLKSFSSKPKAKKTQ